MHKWILGHCIAGAILALVDYILPGHGFNYLAAYLFLITGILVTYLFFGFVEIVLSADQPDCTQGKNVELGVCNSRRRITMHVKQPQ